MKSVICKMKIYSFVSTSRNFGCCKYLYTQACHTNLVNFIFFIREKGGTIQRKPQFVLCGPYDMVFKQHKNIVGNVNIGDYC